jgi:elongation factor P
VGITINEIQSGIGLKVDGNLYLVSDYQHVKPGKGSAFVRVKLRNIKTEQVIERTFKTSERLEDVPLEERRMQNQYKSGNEFHLLDLTTYEQVVVKESFIGESARFLQDNLEVTCLCHDHDILRVELPTFISTEIIHTEPGIKGDSSRAGNKPATMDTGAAILVPLFINQGDRVKIDTRTGAYVERIQR